MVRKDSRILIVGGGTFGLSAAYHFARSGYTDVTVLDKGDALPAPLSAGNDVNKIVRAEYVDPFYSDLALDALAEWTNNPDFAPYYHQTGYLLGVSGAAGAAAASARHTLSLQLGSLQARDAWTGKISLVKTRDDLQRVAPGLDGAMPGWTGYFNTFAGYAHAANSMRSVHRAIVALGVRVKLGQEVTGLLYDGEEENSRKDGKERRCIGVTTAAGARFVADVVVLTLGANIGRVLPAVTPQIAAKGWALAHIQLTPAEAERLRGIPVTFMRDLGFFFEPEIGTGLFKVCAEGAGFSNYIGEEGKQVSVAPSFEDSAILPPAAEAKIRRLLAEALPWLADRPFVGGRVCWCADAADANYIIDRVPGTAGLFVFSGDSGHGFKMLPVAGRWIQDVVEKNGQELPRWRWKESTGDDNTAALHRTGEIEDLQAVRARL